MTAPTSQDDRLAAVRRWHPTAERVTPALLIRLADDKHLPGAFVDHAIDRGYEFYAPATRTFIRLLPDGLDELSVPPTA